VNSSGVLSLVNNPTLSGGTANGVLFLNGSKVATSGSALTFDGTNFASTGIITSTNINGVRAQYPVSASYYAQLDSRDGNTYLSAVGNTASILFRATDGGGTTAEGMRLTSTGLGIGTASPAAKLHVSGQSRVADSSNAANYMTFGVGANAPFGNASISTTTAGLSIVAEGAGNMTFLNNGSEAMRIDTANNLGIGVTPSAWATAGAQKALEVSLAGLSFYGAGNTVSRLTHNAYFDGTNWKYVATNVGATRYDMTGANAGSTHAWFTSVGGTANTTISFTQALTLDASGNLGVGTASPVTNLHVYKTTAATSGVQISSANWGSTLTDGMFVGVDNNNSYVYTYENIPLVFGTNNTERGRFTAGGYFKASDSGTYRNAAGVYHELRNSDGSNPTVFVTNSNASTPYGIAVEFTAAAPDNNTQFFFRAEDNVAIRCYIWADGDLANHDGVYGTISDERLKQDIVDAGSQWDDLKSIRFRKYRMKTDVEANPDAPAMFGVVAQELAQVCPGLVDEHPNMKTVEVTDEEGNVTQTQEPDGTTTLTVKSSILLMKAAKALQEAMARIESLEADMAALKGAK
jgi:hypothetical protein